MKILVLLRLIPVNARNHLWPLIQSPNLTHLTIVRHEPLGFQHPKVSEVHFLQAGNHHNSRVRPLQRIVSVFRLFGLGIRTARQEQPDVIYGIFMIPYGLFVFLIGKLLRKKTMLTLIGTDFNKDVLERPWRHFWRWILRRLDAITIFDEAARQKLITLGIAPEKIFVVPHAIDMIRFTRQAGQPQDIDVIYTGHLWPLKEIWRTLTAWKIVLQHKPEARLVLVGEGSARPDLEKLAHELGIAAQVTFAGWSDDPVSWLSRARIYVNVSGQEGVPLAMLEAMACGVVPVVTAVGGVPSVIQEGINGCLLESPADPQHIAERILHLLITPEALEKMSHEAVKIRDLYGYEAVSRTWQAVFQKLQK